MFPDFCRGGQRRTIAVYFQPTGVSEELLEPLSLLQSSLKDKSEDDALPISAEDEALAALMGSMGLPTGFTDSCNEKAGRHRRQRKPDAVQRATAGIESSMNPASMISAGTSSTHLVSEDTVGIGLRESSTWTSAVLTPEAVDTTLGSNSSVTEPSPLKAIEENLSCSSPEDESCWDIMWSEEYKWHYFVNLLTGASQWEAPPGLEHMNQKFAAAGKQQFPTPYMDEAGGGTLDSGSDIARGANPLAPCGSEAGHVLKGDLSLVEEEFGVMKSAQNRIGEVRDAGHQEAPQVAGSFVEPFRAYSTTQGLINSMAGSTHMSSNLQPCVDETVQELLNVASGHIFNQEATSSQVRPVTLGGGLIPAINEQVYGNAAGEASTTGEPLEMPAVGIDSTIQLIRIGCVVEEDSNGNKTRSAKKKAKVRSKKKLHPDIDGEGKSLMSTSTAITAEVAVTPTDGPGSFAHDVCGIRNVDEEVAAHWYEQYGKYWNQRFVYFSLYDHGIQIDLDGWFSVTPEAIAAHQARRCSCHILVDAFAGVGGNAIQFAFTCQKVIAIDIDPSKIEAARHNAGVYGVANRIEFVVGDFLQLAPSLKADIVYLSPPWGGPEYINVDVYNIQTMLRPVGGFELLNTAQKVAPNVCMFLPRNSDLQQLAAMADLSMQPCEVERNVMKGKLKTVTAYYGSFASGDAAE